MSHVEELPRIRLVDAEADCLFQLGEALSRREPALSRLILREVGRAELCAAGDLPPDVVRIGSTIEFVEEVGGARRTLTLVYPAQADIEAGRLSVLTHVGAGLIGLSPGQSISWPDREGRACRLRIVGVTPPAV